MYQHRHLHVDGFEEHEHEADGEEVVDRDRDHTTARLSFTQLEKKMMIPFSNLDSYCLS